MDRRRDSAPVGGFRMRVLVSGFVSGRRGAVHPVAQVAEPSQDGRRGVLAGEIGMAIAVVGTLLMYDIVN